MRNRISLVAAAAMVLIGIVGAIAAAETETKTVQGELIDMGCYIRQGASGADHVQCAKRCAQRGNPVGVVDSEGQTYVIIAPAPGYADYMGKTVRITGSVKMVTIDPQKLEVKGDDGWTEVPLKGGAPAA